MTPNRRGNVLLYVLLAVALLAALAYAVSGSMRGQQANRMTAERTELMGVGLMSHMAAIEQAVFQMTQFGVYYQDILFDLPGSTDYTSNTARQVFHPSGGGVTPFGGNDNNLFDPDSASKRGWVLQNQTNVAWTPTGETDMIYSFLDLNPQICAYLNRKIIGGEDIPDVTFDFENVFTTDGSNIALTETLCPECENRRALCVKNNNAYAFYYIIGAH